MSTPSPQDVTQLLLAWSQGEQTALEKLTPLVYKELHRLARHYMGRERPHHTLQTAALVNEVYLRLMDCSRVRWQNRAHFLAISAQLMPPSSKKPARRTRPYVRKSNHCWLNRKKLKVL